MRLHNKPSVSGLLLLRPLSVLSVSVNFTDMPSVLNNMQNTGYLCSICYSCHDYKLSKFVCSKPAKFVARYVKHRFKRVFLFWWLKLDNFIHENFIHQTIQWATKYYQTQLVSGLGTIQWGCIYFVRIYKSEQCSYFSYSLKYSQHYRQLPADSKIQTSSFSKLSHPDWQFCTKFWRFVIESILSLLVDSKNSRRLLSNKAQLIYM